MKIIGITLATVIVGISLLDIVLSRIERVASNKTGIIGLVSFAVAMILYACVASILIRLHAKIRRDNDQKHGLISAEDPRPSEQDRKSIATRWQQLRIGAAVGLIAESLVGMATDHAVTEVAVKIFVYEMLFATSVSEITALAPGSKLSAVVRRTVRLRLAAKSLLSIGAVVPIVAYIAISVPRTGNDALYWGALGLAVFLAVTLLTSHLQCMQFKD